MALSNCVNCGSLYNRIRDELCPKCISELDEHFIRIREYLKQNRNASPAEVEQATDIPVSTILKFLRQGRLTSAYGSNLYYPCEKCGSPITSGTYCNACNTELSRSLQKAKSSLKSRENENRGFGYHSRNK